MNSTATRNDLTDVPLYASKPQRRIPGTNAVAVTMYRSEDGSVRHYAVFTADGTAYLGHAYYRPALRHSRGGYFTEPHPHFAAPRWANLADFATEMAARHGLTV